MSQVMMRETAPVQDEDVLLTFKETMGYLRVSRSTLYRLMWAGHITGHKVGFTWRFWRSDVHGCVGRVATETIAANRLPVEAPATDPRIQELAGLYGVDIEHRGKQFFVAEKAGTCLGEAQKAALATKLTAVYAEMRRETK